MVTKNTYSHERFIYEIDTFGFSVLPQVFSQDEMSLMNEVLDSINNELSLGKTQFKYGCKVGKPELLPEEAYISNIVEQDPRLYFLIDHQLLIEKVRSIMIGRIRLNHTYSIDRLGRGGYTYMHMGGFPIHPRATYSIRGTQIHSSLTKVVIPLEGFAAEDGVFAVLPGSHKANFERPYSNVPEENYGILPVESKSGDVVIFTDALAHGSFEKKSLGRRRALFLTYSVASLPDWGGRLQLSFSPDFVSELSESQKEIISLDI